MSASRATTRSCTSALLEGVRVAVFGAREHYYENGNPRAMLLPLQVLKALGATDLILTNAAGSLRPDIAPGDLMLLSDHINYSRPATR